MPGSIPKREAGRLVREERGEGGGTVVKLERARALELAFSRGGGTEERVVAVVGAGERGVGHCDGDGGCV